MDEYCLPKCAQNADAVINMTRNSYYKETLHVEWQQQEKNIQNCQSAHEQGPKQAPHTI
jgi:hypothetical protein